MGLTGEGGRRGRGRRGRSVCVCTWERTGFTGLLNRHMADRLGTPYLQKILNQVR